MLGQMQDWPLRIHKIIDFAAPGQQYTMFRAGAADIAAGNFVDLLRQRNLNLRHLVEKRQTLEELFMETVDAAEPGVDAPRARAPVTLVQPATRK